MFQNVGYVFWMYFWAYFCARIPGRIINKVLEGMDFSFPEEWIVKAPMVIFTSTLVCSVLLWSVLTSYFFALFKKQEFKITHMRDLSVTYCIVMIPLVIIGIKGIIPAQMMLVGIPITFVIGLFITAKYYPKPNE